MSTIPEAAVEAAAEELFYAEDEALGYPRELRRWEAQYPDQDGDWHDYWRDRARVTLEAAAPIIEAASKAKNDLLVQELATLWEATCDALNLDTDASAGEWRTAFDAKIADYHNAGYEAGLSDARNQIAEEIRAIPVGDFRTYDCLPSDYANMGRAEMREKVAQIAERSGE